MGIGNATHSALSCFRTVFSLPLMGIGNEPVGASDVVVRVTHYPSWGSGTRGIPAESARRYQAHYPSWGSGTHRRRRPNPRYRTHLITPHGDRELTTVNFACADHTRSLPLMGIGNHESRRSLWDLLTLITPHGDREPTGLALNQA